jgi:hypothetical protein
MGLNRAACYRRLHDLWQKERSLGYVPEEDVENILLDALTDDALIRLGKRVRARVDSRVGDLPMQMQRASTPEDEALSDADIERYWLSEAEEPENPISLIDEQREEIGHLLTNTDIERPILIQQLRYFLALALLAVDHLHLEMEMHQMTIDLAHERIAELERQEAFGPPA